MDGKGFEDDLEGGLDLPSPGRYAAVPRNAILTTCERERRVSKKGIV